MLVAFTLLILSACKKDDQPNTEEESSGKMQTFTFTVNGNGIENKVYEREYPLESHGGLSYFEPQNGYERITALLPHDEGKPGMKVYFVYLNDEIQPLAEQEFNNQSTSNIEVIFEHAGEIYQLQSTSGSCISHSMEIQPFSESSGKSSFNVSFSGQFIKYDGSTNIPYEIEGEIEIHEN